MLNAVGIKDWKPGIRCVSRVPVSRLLGRRPEAAEKSQGAAMKSGKPLLGRVEIVAMPIQALLADQY